MIISSSLIGKRMKLNNISYEQLIKMKQLRYCSTCGEKIPDVDKYFFLNWIRKITKEKKDNLYNLNVHSLHVLYKKLKQNLNC